MSKHDNKRILQSRWKIVEVEGTPHLLYYGVRNPPHHQNVLLPVSPGLATRLEAHASLTLAELDSTRTEAEALVKQHILVRPEHLRPTKTPETMQVCTQCVNNDYVVPGLEFDNKGVCALCQCYAQTRTPSRSFFTTISEEELLKKAAHNRDSRFDAMVLYTGGKDSSYLLWLLARRLKLRVLAAFWNMPYCSDAAYENIRRAKQQMPEVEFVEWALPLNMVREAMRTKWRAHGWPCLCPTAAFPTLYPLATQLRIPYVFLGLEDIQAAVLDYVVAKPEPSGTPPSARDQTLGFLSARALPRAMKTPVHWPDEMSNYHVAVRQAMPELFHDLADLVQLARQDSSLRIPLIGRLSTNEEYGTWEDARQIIEQEMAWQAPVGQTSMLHTSCAIEPVKDYLQFQRFKAMRTVFMPQSIVELSAAVHFGLVNRADALVAVRELGYWKPPLILDKLTSDLEISREDVEASTDELRPSLAEWAGLTS